MRTLSMNEYVSWKERKGNCWVFIKWTQFSQHVQPTQKLINIFKPAVKFSLSSRALSSAPSKIKKQKKLAAILSRSQIYVVSH